MQHPKVVIVGAGSLFFGRQAIWQMVHSEQLRGGTLALVDNQPAHLAKMAALARKVVEHHRAPLAIEASTDHREVLKDADFVVLSFADRSVKFRGIDCEVSEAYGVRMCSGDTIGPGGVFRTLREFPQILRIGRDCRELCPDAWVINYINPTAANGIGLQRFLPEMKTFALCDGLHMPHVKKRYAVRAGIIGWDDEMTPEIDRDFELVIAGPNHFTWVLKAEYKGRDVAGEIAENLRQEAATETDGGDKGAKARFNMSISYALYEAFGFVPACTGHTKEYVRFWQGLNTAPDAIPPLTLWETGDRYERHAQMWREVDEFVLETRPIGEYDTYVGPDHATDIIETMWGGLGKPFYINTPNRGAVTNLPDDAFLEMLCDVTMDGPAPRPVGDAPVGLRGLWQQVLDTHELSARAAVEMDRDVLLRAMVCDPIVNSLVDARAIIEELLDRQRDALPAGWFDGR
jgi:alpha-galactosidase